MGEYATLGHMRPVKGPTSETGQVVYLPHHPVVKLSSQTTKLRVVFNASSPSTNKQSLNDCQLVGPKLQADLTILLETTDLQ